MSPEKLTNRNTFRQPMANDPKLATVAGDFYPARLADKLSKFHLGIIRVLKGDESERQGFYNSITKTNTVT